MKKPTLTESIRGHLDLFDSQQEQNITEWREAYLYHVAMIPTAIKIWREDALTGSTGQTLSSPGGASTTRNYNYALGFLRAMVARGRVGGVIYWIDQDLVRRDMGRRRLTGYDWFWDKMPDDMSDEYRRRNDWLDTDRAETVIQKGLDPFRKYVSKIEIWLPMISERLPLPATASHEERTEYMSGHPRYDTEPQVHQQLLDTWLRDPLNKQAWESMLRDSRTEVKKELGAPKTYQGKPVEPKVKYDDDHPLYAGRPEY